jgi:hypothetical protein
MEQKKPTAKLVPLHTEIVLASCDVDEIRQFTSLRIRIRDRDDVGVNIEFKNPLAFRVYDEGQTLLDPLYVPETGFTGHWLYESDGLRVSPLVPRTKLRYAPKSQHQRLHHHDEQRHC